MKAQPFKGHVEDIADLFGIGAGTGEWSYCAHPECQRPLSADRPINAKFCSKTCAQTARYVGRKSQRVQ